MKVGITSKEILALYDESDYDFNLVRLNNFDDPLIQEVEVLIAGRLSNSQIEYAKKLKHVFIPFTGKNGFDLEYLKEKGIKLHTTSAHSKFVAERALALILSLLGKITFYDRELREKRWGERNFSNRVSWDSLSNKTVGIYGYGSIGKLIHSYVLPMTDKVFVYSRTLKDNVQNTASLEELFDVSDIVFVAVPLSEETEDSINGSIIQRNKNKIIINVARGKIVNEDALYEGLVNGNLSGYASDVWYNYPTKEEPVVQPSKYDLSKFNVVMTPHCGGFADNSQELRYNDTLLNISKVKG